MPEDSNWPRLGRRLRGLRTTPRQPQGGDRDESSGGALCQPTPVVVRLRRRRPRSAGTAYSLGSGIHDILMFCSTADALEAIRAACRATIIRFRAGITIARRRSSASWRTSRTTRVQRGWRAAVGRSASSAHPAARSALGGWRRKPGLGSAAIVGGRRPRPPARLSTARTCRCGRGSWRRTLWPPTRTGSRPCRFRRSSASAPTRPRGCCCTS